MEAAFCLWAVRKMLISQKNNTQKYHLPTEFTFICLFIRFHFVHNKFRILNYFFLCSTDEKNILDRVTAEFFSDEVKSNKNIFF